MATRTTSADIRFFMRLLWLGGCSSVVPSRRCLPAKFSPSRGVSRCRSDAENSDHRTPQVPQVNPRPLAHRDRYIAVPPSPGGKKPSSIARWPWPSSWIAARPIVLVRLGEVVGLPGVSCRIATTHTAYGASFMIRSPWSGRCANRRTWSRALWLRSREEPPIPESPVAAFDFKVASRDQRRDV